jgi:hypothetical protein
MQYFTQLLVQKAQLQTSTVVLAAIGYMKVSKDENKNYVIKVRSLQQ